MRLSIWWSPLGLTVLLISGCATAPNGADSNTVPLGEVVALAKQEVKDYQDHPVAGEPLPDLKTAEFTFKTVRTAAGGLSVNVYVFKLGWSHSREATHSVTYTYDVPKDNESRITRRLKPPRADSLSETIRRAAEAAKQATKFGDLPLSEMAIEVEFVIKSGGNVGVEVPFSIVTVGANVSGDKSTTQSVKLVFKKKRTTR